VGHTGLVSQKGGEMARFGLVISGEGSHSASVGSGSFSGEESQRSSSGSSEFSMRHCLFLR
jgi:hypothetical protein